MLLPAESYAAVGRGGGRDYPYVIGSLEAIRSIGPEGVDARLKELKKSLTEVLDEHPSTLRGINRSATSTRRSPLAALQLLPRPCAESGP